MLIPVSLIWIEHYCESFTKQLERLREEHEWQATLADLRVRIAKDDARGAIDPSIDCFCQIADVLKKCPLQLGLDGITSEEVSNLSTMAIQSIGEALYRKREQMENHPFQPAFVQATEGEFGVMLHPRKFLTAQLKHIVETRGEYLMHPLRLEAGCMLFLKALVCEDQILETFVLKEFAGHIGFLRRASEIRAKAQEILHPEECIATRFHKRHLEVVDVGKSSCEVIVYEFPQGARVVWLLHPIWNRQNAKFWRCFIVGEMFESHTIPFRPSPSTHQAKALSLQVPLLLRASIKHRFQR